MHAVAINHLPYKIPLACLAALALSLAILHYAGLITVHLGLPPPRLLLIVAAYLAILSGIVWFDLSILKQMKVVISCSDRQSQPDYEQNKRKETEKAVEKLKQDERYKRWLQEHKDGSRSNIIYEVIEGESEEEPMIVSCHQLATMKKLF